MGDGCSGRPPSNRRPLPHEQGQRRFKGAEACVLVLRATHHTTAQMSPCCPNGELQPQCSGGPAWPSVAVCHHMTAQMSPCCPAPARPCRASTARISRRAPTKSFTKRARSCRGGTWRDSSCTSVCKLCDPTKSFVKRARSCSCVQGRRAGDLQLQFSAVGTARTTS